MSSRKAVIVVGSHHAGKSKTINKYLKPKLGIGRYEHKFSLDGHEGRIFSQSREEATRGFVKSQSLEETGQKNVASVVRQYSRYDLLVMAARPSDEPVSFLKQLTSRLKVAGYGVNIVKVAKSRSVRQHKASAAEILRHLLN
jgi:hypothetical protein